MCSERGEHPRAREQKVFCVQCRRGSGSQNTIKKQSKARLGAIPVDQFGGPNGSKQQHWNFKGMSRLREMRSMGGCK